MFAKAGPGLKGYIDPSGSELKCTPAGNTYVLGKLHAHLAHLCTKQQGQTKKRHDPQKPRKHENEQAKDQGSRSQLLEAMADSAEMRRCRSATCSRVHARDLDPRYLVKFQELLEEGCGYPQCRLLFAAENNGQNRSLYI